MKPAATIDISATVKPTDGPGERCKVEPSTTPPPEAKPPVTRRIVPSDVALQVMGCIIATVMKSHYRRR